MSELHGQRMGFVKLRGFDYFMKSLKQLIKSSSYIYNGSLHSHFFVSTENQNFWCYLLI